jgi:hypothetical protein
VGDVAVSRKVEHARFPRESLRNGTNLGGQCSAGGSTSMMINIFPSCSPVRTHPCACVSRSRTTPRETGETPTRWMYLLTAC